MQYIFYEKTNKLKSINSTQVGKSEQLDIVLKCFPCISYTRTCKVMINIFSHILTCTAYTV